MDAKRILAETNNCVIIRPTGFGKTGILTKFIDDYTNILYLYPSDVVRQAVLRFYYQNDIPDDEAIDNVKFMTYTKLAMMKSLTFSIFLSMTASFLMNVIRLELLRHAINLTCFLTLKKKHTHFI